jgi:hypothetical protein
MNITQALPLLEAPTCWQKTVDSVTTTWDAIWERGGLFIHAITWIFFRVISIFTPAAIAIEVLLCHAIAIIQNLRSSSKQQTLKDEIQTLTQSKETLATENQQMKNEAIAAKIAFDQINFDKNLAETERDTARGQRDLSIEGKTNLTLERDTFKLLATQLQEQLSQKTLQASQLTQKSTSLQTEKEQLQQTVSNLEMSLSQQSQHAHLSDQLDKIQVAYEEDKKARLPGTENMADKELELLLPLYEDTKRELRQMLAARIGDFEPYSPEAIAIQGFIDLSEKESNHQERISQLIRFHKELRESCTNYATHLELSRLYIEP